MSEANNYLQNQLNKLWEKVQEDMDSNSPSSPFTKWGKRRIWEEGGARSPFEKVQAEIQRESIHLLRARFEKEKSYWENLVAAKEETIAQLQKEVAEWQKKYEELKNKVAELQNNQSVLFQQSFSTLDLQRKSLYAHIEKLEADLADARREILNLTIQLKEEKAEEEKMLQEFEAKERNWFAEREKRETELSEIKKQLFEKRQDELDEIAQLEKMIAELKNELQKSKELSETERNGLQNLLQEKEIQMEKLAAELEQLKSQLETERKEREMAALERERQLTEERDAKKRMVEQLLSREGKIKELQESLERNIKERREREELLQKREEEILLQEEALRKRREEWVESIKEQSGQQLSISGRVVELLNKLEIKMGMRTHSQWGTHSLPQAGLLQPPRLSTATSPQPLPHPSSPYKGKEKLRAALEFIKSKRGVILLSIGSALFVLAAMLLFLETEGRKTSRAMKYLDEGNQFFSKGEMESALGFFEKAYKLDPQNSMVKNSLTLALADLAHKEFREGKYEEALKRTELLAKILPEDPEVVQLHQSILQAIGHKNSGH